MKLHGCFGSGIKALAKSAFYLVNDLEPRNIKRYLDKKGPD